MAVAALSLLAAACGSRVPASERNPAGAAAVEPEDAVGAPMFDAPGAATGAKPSPLGVVATGGVPTAAEVAAVVAAPGISPPVAAAREDLRVGFVMIKPDTVEVIGLTVRTPDMKPVVRALVDEINDTGGIAGRRIVPVIHETDVSLTPDIATRTHEAACVRLTEDEHVFLVVSLDSNIVAAAGCYARHRTPFLDANGGFAPDALHRELHPWILPSPSPTLDTMAKLYVDALDRQGFLNDRIGLWVYDTPEWRDTAKSVLIPLIEQHGGKVAAMFIGFVGDGSEAVFRFKASGVDRVLMWDFGIAWVELATAAETQAWRPRWAVHSQVGPSDSTRNVPDAQKPGTIGVGWAPMGDVRDADLPLTDRERACFEVVARRTGISMNSRSPADSEGDFRPGYTLGTCGLLDILRTALEHAPDSSSIDATDVWGLVANLGSQPPSITPPQTFFSPEHFDGATGYADLGYFEECDCFRYVSEWRAIER